MAAKYKDLVDYGKLRDIGGYSLWARMVDNGNGKPYVDIREHIELRSYTGFTRRGITLGWEELHKLRDLIPKMIDDFDKFYTPEEYRETAEGKCA
ncbi:MAG: transcriptional coactivator p15/PC4 family protein [Deltaproteobacteria bacterium]|nr:transcriptional coactivator p15/PC4 family protein [Deltaproteobacteria bacterium]